MKSIWTIVVITLLSWATIAPGSEQVKELTVDQAVSMALKENLDLKLQQSEVALRKGTELIENGAFDPRIEAGISSQEQRMTSLIAGDAEEESAALWSAAIKKKMQTGTEVALTWENGRTDSDSTFALINPSYSSTLGVSVSQPLLRGNGTDIQTAGKRAAEKQTAAAVFLVERQAADLAAEVKKAYWELVFAHQDIEAKRLSLKLARNLHEETSKKIDNGVLANALATRPDILAGDLQVEAGEILVSKAEDSLKPKLDLAGAVGVNGFDGSYNNTVDRTFSDSDFSWQLGLTFSLPIGNQTARGSRTRARAELAKNKIRAELLRQQTEKNVREAVRDVNLAMKTIEATRKTSLAAQKRLEAEEAKFKIGLATANDVLESQDVYARALAGEKRALVDLAKAQAELDRVQGIISFRKARPDNA